MKNKSYNWKFYYLSKLPIQGLSLYNLDKEKKSGLRKQKIFLLFQKSSSLEMDFSLIEASVLRNCYLNLLC